MAKDYVTNFFFVCLVVKTISGSSVDFEIILVKCIFARLHSSHICLAVCIGLRRLQIFHIILQRTANVIFILIFGNTSLPVIIHCIFRSFIVYFLNRLLNLSVIFCKMLVNGLNFIQDLCAELLNLCQCLSCTTSTKNEPINKRRRLLKFLIARCTRDPYKRIPAD